MHKIENGIFYTLANPFANEAFRRWARKADLPANPILEPFAGANHLIRHLETMELCHRFDSFDIAPNAPSVVQRDTLQDFPDGYAVCITNPPWLAKNRAKRVGVRYPQTAYNDLYKLALSKCLEHCAWLAALVPESFIQSDSLQDRLTDFVSLTGDLFGDTTHPSGLALFAPASSRDVVVWQNNKKLGLLSALKALRPVQNKAVRVRFNDPRGNVGLVAIDNIREPSIRFCDPVELGCYSVRHSSRAITKLWVEGAIKTSLWNAWIAQFRRDTHDILLTSFKGRRKDGQYRRRMDYALARRIINHV